MHFPWQKDKAAPPTRLMDAMEPTAGGMELCCDVYSISETGPTRLGNEDSVAFCHPEGSKGNLFAMVADGMGGHRAGEVASRLACDFALNYVQTHYNDADANSSLVKLAKQAHQAILAAANKNDSYIGMGTTATMLLVRNRHVYYAHVGDSRLYMLHKGQLQKCTTDHTLVNQWVKEGKITAAEATNHSMKNVITQALGTINEIRPETGGKDFRISDGDRFFICSDGIYDVLSDEELQDLLKMRQPKMAMDCIRLLCTDRIAADNFSAILVDVNYKTVPSAAGITKEQNIYQQKP